MNYLSYNNLRITYSKILVKDIMGRLKTPVIIHTNFNCPKKDTTNQKKYDILIPMDTGEKNYYERELIISIATSAAVDMLKETSASEDGDTDI